MTFFGFTDNMEVMKKLPRTLSQIIINERKTYSKMIFVSGPRQVGKTTVLSQIREKYDGAILNWDNLDDRKIISRSASELFENNKNIYFDEIHKQPRWKGFLKGYFDKYGEACNIYVTGSARLDVYRRGGDSLLGRYIHFRLHPFTVGEILNPLSIAKEKTIEEILAPDSKDNKRAGEIFALLEKFGGFPEPFISQSDIFYKRWKNLRHERLVREDIRDMTRLRELALLEKMISLIPERIAQPFSLNSIKEELEVSHDSARLWIHTLEEFYYLFFITPYTKKISRSSKKERKGYLWDYSELTSSGQKFENMIASHLLKWAHFNYDMGYSEIDIHFLKNKQKEEADFLITIERKPAFIVEAKLGDENPSKSALKHSIALNSIPVLQLTRKEDVFTERRFDKVRWILMSASRFLSGLP